MTYTVEFTTAAARQVKKLPRAERGKVVDAIAQLEEDPRPHGARKLVGEKTAWRIRVGGLSRHLRRLRSGTPGHCGESRTSP